MSCWTFGRMRASLESCRSASKPQAMQIIRSPAYRGLQSNTHSSCCASGSFLGRSDVLAPQNGSKIQMMRHGRKVPRLGRPADQRKALLRSLTTEVLRHGGIKTTEIRAKAVRKYVDKMIQLAKRGDLHARRQVLAFVYDKDVVARLFDQVNSRYADRNSGYCRIKKETYSSKLERDAPIRSRRGDNAKMVAIELV